MMSYSSCILTLLEPDSVERHWYILDYDIEQCACRSMWRDRIRFFVLGQQEV